MGIRCDIQTPGTPGAVAIFQIAGEPGELVAALATLDIEGIEVGQIALRDLFGIDRGLVARWSETSIHLMPHGGAAVVRAIAAELARRGVPHEPAPDPRATYPEASSDIEARTLAALARAASPLAVELLLSQPRRWAQWEMAQREASTAIPGPDPSHSRTLNHLIGPPLVVAVGPPNVGKSALVNALAGRQVSIVADQPGTTRDHVGVGIDLAGLVVRYIDTPGLGRGTSAIERDAETIARDVMASADLVLSCGDASAEPAAFATLRQVLIVATRSDLGLPSWKHDLSTSALTGSGIPALVAGIRETLVPAAVIADPRPWQFW